MKTVVMLSGGIDSILAWEYLGRPPCVHVDLGLPYSAKELDAVISLMTKTGMDLDIVHMHGHNLEVTASESFIPGRNLLLGVIGSWYGDHICIGGVLGDDVEDNTAASFSDMSATLSAYSRKTVELFTPFRDKTKADIIRWYAEKQGGDVEVLHSAVGCYSGVADHCGDCPCCARKWIALKAAGIEPRFELSSRMQLFYLRRARHDYYHPRRNSDILRAMGDK